MRGYTIYPKPLFRYYRTAPNRIANCTEQYRIFQRFFIYFFTGQKKNRVRTKIIGRVGLHEPNNFFVLASCHEQTVGSGYTLFTILPIKRWRINHFCVVNVVCFSVLLHIFKCNRLYHGSKHYNASCEFFYIFFLSLQGKILKILR